MVAGLFRRFAMLGIALALPAAASGQANFGVHGAYAADSYGGAYGAGASLEVGFPVLPVAFLVAAEHFFVDCGAAEGCSLRGGSADVHLEMPLVALQPYAAAGLVLRQSDAGDSEGRTTHRGFGAGVGINLGAVLIGGYAEARYEFVDPDDQLVIRVGIRF